MNDSELTKIISSIILELEQVKQAIKELEEMFKERDLKNEH